jgi:tellurite resistance protein TehA-like permease
MPPAAGASVMATSIVSIGLELDGHQTVSRALLAAAVVLWVGLAVLAADELVTARGLFMTQVCSPAALTVVADTAVLGSRLLLLRWTRLAEAALALGTCLGLLLLPRVLRAWQQPAVGVSFLLPVAIQALAALAAATAVVTRSDGLAVAALIALAAGLVSYLFVLRSFDLGQLYAGQGDHWVAGGALAISALACARAAQATDTLAPLHGLAGALSDCSLALWAAAVLWLPALIVAELRSARTAYDIRRWSTVFPFGMYAVCSFATAQVASLSGLDAFARVWIWVAVAVWTAIALELLANTLAPLRRS